MPVTRGGREWRVHTAIAVAISIVAAAGCAPQVDQDAVLQVPAVECFLNPRDPAAALEAGALHAAPGNARRAGSAAEGQRGSIDGRGTPTVSAADGRGGAIWRAPLPVAAAPHAAPCDLPCPGALVRVGPFQVDAASSGSLRAVLALGGLTIALLAAALAWIWWRQRLGSSAQ